MYIRSKNKTYALMTLLKSLKLYTVHVTTSKEIVTALDTKWTSTIPEWREEG